MAEFNLPFGVRIANNDPVDFDRYVATNIAARDAVVTAGRAYEGLQVYVEADQTLYILTNVSPPNWDIVGSDASALVNLQDYIDGSLAVRDASITSLDGSVNFVFGAIESLDTSIGILESSVNYLYNNKVDKTQFEASIGELVLQTDFDNSVNYLYNNKVDKTQFEASIGELDASVEELFGSTTESWNGLTTTLDNSIGLGGTLSKPTEIGIGSNLFTIGQSDISVYIGDLSPFGHETGFSAIAAVNSGANGSSIIVDSSNLIFLFSDAGNFVADNFTMSTTGAVFSHLFGSGQGIIYGGDYEPGFVSRSLITKQFVEGITDSLDSSITDLRNNKLDNTTDTFTGILTIDGSLTISKDLTVDGSVTYINTTNLDVSDNIILINSGMTGTPPATMVSGMRVDRGTEDPYFFIFSEDDDTFRIGTETDEGSLPGDTQAVATREDSPFSTGIPFWNFSEKRFDTSTGLKFSGGFLYVGDFGMRDTGSQGELRYGTPRFTVTSTATRLSAPSATNAINLTSGSLLMNHPSSIALGNLSGVSYVTVRDPATSSWNNDTFNVQAPSALALGAIFRVSADGSILAPHIAEVSTNKVLFYDTGSGNITYEDVDTFTPSGSTGYIPTYGSPLSQSTLYFSGGTFVNNAEEDFTIQSYYKGSGNGNDLIIRTPDVSSSAGDIIIKAGNSDLPNQRGSIALVPGDQPGQGIIELSDNNSANTTILLSARGSGSNVAIAVTPKGTSPVMIRSRAVIGSGNEFDFQYSSTYHQLTIDADKPGLITMGSSGTGVDPNELIIRGGQSVDASFGGDLILQGGTAGNEGVGGTLILRAGQGTAGGIDGSIFLENIAEASTNKILFYNTFNGDVTYGDAPQGGTQVEGSTNTIPKYNSTEDGLEDTVYQINSSNEFTIKDGETNDMKIVSGVSGGNLHIKTYDNGASDFYLDPRNGILNLGRDMSRTYMTLQAGGTQSNIELRFIAKGNGDINLWTGDSGKIELGSRYGTAGRLEFNLQTSTLSHMVGGDFTIAGGTGIVSASDGNFLKLVGGDAYPSSGNGRGGDLILSPGSGRGTGVDGSIFLYKLTDASTDKILYYNPDSSAITYGDAPGGGSDPNAGKTPLVNYGTGSSFTFDLGRDTRAKCIINNGDASLFIDDASLSSTYSHTMVLDITGSSATTRSLIWDPSLSSDNWVDGDVLSQVDNTSTWVVTINTNGNTYGDILINYIKKGV